MRLHKNNKKQPMMMTTFLSLKEHEDEAEDVYLLEEDDERNMQTHGLEYIEEGFIQKLKCVKCGLFIAEREGCFACPGCPYTTHKACTKLPETISGHPFVGGVLSLKDRPKFLPESQCYYCREAVHPRSSDPYYIGAITSTYQSDSVFVAYFAMHATCALIPLPEMIKSSGKYICHRRQMSLVEKQDGGECFSCGFPGLGSPVYRCTGAGHCKIFFHKSCAELPWTKRHPSHGGGEHKLSLTVGRPERCGACGKTGCRHVYYCERRTGASGIYGDECEAFVLGAECVFQSTALPVRLVTSHMHELFLVEGRPATFRCDGCRKFHGAAGDSIPVEVQRTREVSFRCRECLSDLHFLCGPLPSSVEFRFHIHPLRLVDLLIEDDSGEYCCDVCEEDRDPRFRVYHCPGCKFVAHIHCLYFEIMKLLKDESSPNVEFLILGESSPDGCTTDVESLKSWPESTLKDLISDQDLSTISFLIHKSDSSRENITFNDQGNRLMNFFDGNKEHKYVDVDDIAEELFHLNPTNVSELCLHIFRLRTKVVFGLNTKYLNMKVVEFRGYMVPWALASDLKMLLSKYGDLGGDSTLTPRLKSIAATLLCVVVNEMRNIMAEDMSIKDVKDWLTNLDRAKKIAGYKVRECDYFEEAVMTTFLGFEATRFEKEAKKSIDLKIAELESELERWKWKREKLEELASTKSDYMKECLRKASRSIWKTVYKLF